MVNPCGEVLFKSFKSWFSSNLPLCSLCRKVFFIVLVLLPNKDFLCNPFYNRFPSELPPNHLLQQAPPLRQTSPACLLSTVRSSQHQPLFSLAYAFVEHLQFKRISNSNPPPGSLVASPFLQPSTRNFSKTEQQRSTLYILSH
ncbi:hypothetical protein CRENBAI_008655 [Crenichthys baileyi]|uniref:Uncharacterized protein n=1 Tax=Crenichthys baileyi TaxID=28760 RepID=A0AAV9R468_9TELE